MSRYNFQNECYLVLIIIYNSTSSGWTSISKFSSRQHNNKSANNTVEDYFKDLKNIRLSDSKPTTSLENVFINCANSDYNSILLLYV
jgi:Cdc6-like AAA superfamily ATPase